MKFLGHSKNTHSRYSTGFVTTVSDAVSSSPYLKLWDITYCNYSFILIHRVLLTWDISTTRKTLQDPHKGWGSQNTSMMEVPTTPLAHSKSKAQPRRRRSTMIMKNLGLVTQPTIHPGL